MTRHGSGLTHRSARPMVSAATEVLWHASRDIDSLAVAARVRNRIDRKCLVA